MTTTTSPTEKQLRAILDEAVHLAAEAADTAEINAGTCSTEDQEYLDDLMIRSHQESQQVVKNAESARDCAPGRLVYYVRRAVDHARETQAIASVPITAQDLADWLDTPDQIRYPVLTANKQTPTTGSEQPAPRRTAVRLHWRRAYTWAVLALTALILIIR